jgi:hypothetical protein
MGDQNGGEYNPYRRYTRIKCIPNFGWENLSMLVMLRILEQRYYLAISIHVSSIKQYEDITIVCPVL